MVYCDRNCESEIRISEYTNLQIQHAEAVTTVAEVSEPELNSHKFVRGTARTNTDLLPAGRAMHSNHILTAEELLEAGELANLFFDEISTDEPNVENDVANIAFIGDITPAKAVIAKQQKYAEAQDLKRLMYDRLGRSYFRVTDFVQQSWCELKAEYAARHEIVTDIVHEVVAPLEVIKPEVKTGREVHKAKELEVAPPTVPVTVLLPQDRKAVYLHNVLFYVKQFVVNSSPGHIEREISILGAIKQQALIFGQIDELKLDADKYELELVELKTRMHPSLPRNAQSTGHKMQVMMYAYLWNQLLFGGSQEDHFEALMPGVLGNLWHVNIDAPLSKKCREDLYGADDSSSSIGPYTNLRTLLAEIRRFGAAAPPITKLTVRYVLQQRRKRAKKLPVADNDDDIQIVAEAEPKEVVIGELNYKYDHAWLMERIDRFLQAWRGERELEGVSVEEAWKCQYCEFHDICEWRISRAGECQKSVVPALRLNLNENQKRKLDNLGKRD